MKFSLALPGTSVVGMRQKAEQEDGVICYISNERLRSRSDTDIRIHPEPKGRNVRFKLDFKCIASCISSIRKENLDHNHALGPTGRMHTRHIMLHQLQYSSEAVQGCLFTRNTVLTHRSCTEIYQLCAHDVQSSLKDQVGQVG